MTGARIEESKEASGAAVASISGMALNKGNLFIYFLQKLRHDNPLLYLEDDVTAV